MNSRRGTSALGIALVVVSVMVAVLGAYVFVADQGCEIACGSDGDRTTRALLFAATAVGAAIAALLGARRSLKASTLVLAAAAMCFLIAFGEGLSHLN